MADENTQNAQNTQPQAANPAPASAVATPVTQPVMAKPAVQSVTPSAATQVQPATQTPTPVATPAPTQAVPQIQPLVATSVTTPTPAPKPAEKSGGLSGLGLGAFKGALDSAKGAVNTAKNAAGQSQSGLSKLTGTLSSMGGNVMGAVTGACTCPEVKAENWDKKRITLHKTFYKTFSTRILGHHFTDAIDKNRGMIEIKVKDYKTPANPMILDTNDLFLATLYIEVEGANPQDPKVVTFDKELYCKVSKNRSRKDLKQDIIALEQEMGKKPSEIYFWFVTCSKCGAGKEVRTVIMAA